jgi:hypothetical protein
MPRAAGPEANLQKAVAGIALGASAGPGAGKCNQVALVSCGEPIVRQLQRRPRLGSGEALQVHPHGCHRAAKDETLAALRELQPIGNLNFHRFPPILSTAYRGAHFAYRGVHFAYRGVNTED